MKTARHPPWLLNQGRDAGSLHYYIQRIIKAVWKTAPVLLRWDFHFTGLSLLHRRLLWFTDSIGFCNFSSIIYQDLSVTMDADSWAARLSSTSRRYQSASQSRSGMRWDGIDSEMLIGFEETDIVEDDVREEFPCPFCSEYYDVVGLCCHVDDEHPVEAKNGVCPVCATRVGVDMVAHVVLQHGNIFKVQQKRKSRKSSSQSTLSLLRKKLREGNFQSLIAGGGGGSSSFIAPPSSAAAPDPLTSFILPMADDFGNGQLHSSAAAISARKSTSEKVPERKQPPLSIKDKEERTKRSQFVQGLLLSTILPDNLFDN